jgi:hypothetical protein
LLAQLNWTDDDLAAWLHTAVSELGGTPDIAEAGSGSDRAVTVGDLVSAAAALGVPAGRLLLAAVRGRTSAFAVVDTSAVVATSAVELAPARRWARVQPAVGVLDCSELVEVAAACGMSTPRLWQVLAEVEALLPDVCPQPCGRLAPAVDGWLAYAGVSAQLREARLAHSDLGLLELRTAVGASGPANWETGPRHVESMPLSIYLTLCERLRVSAAWVFDHACELRATPWLPINVRCRRDRGDGQAIRTWGESSGWRADPTGTVMVHQGALPTLTRALGVATDADEPQDHGPADLATGQPLPRRLRRPRLSVCPE